MVGIVGLVVAVIAVVVSVIAALYQRRSVPPKLELSVRTATTSVLPKDSAIRGRITMAYEDGRPLADPRLVQIDLHNTGSTAIGKDLYDGDPYVVRFGGQVIAMVGEGNNLQDRTAPAARISDSELLIGPGTIHQGQKLSYAVLIDGRAAVERSCPIKNLSLVDLNAGAGPQTPRAIEVRFLGERLPVTALGVASIVVLGVALWLTSQGTPDRPDNCVRDKGEVVCTVPAPPVTVTVTQSPRPTPP